MFFIVKGNKGNNLCSSQNAIFGCIFCLFVVIGG